MREIGFEEIICFLLVGGLTAPLFGFGIWMVLSAFMGNACPVVTR